MAPWKTSTAGSARLTSTSSNRRQACLKAALRGGFLISPPLPAQTRDIARRSSLPLRPTGFAMRSLGGVRFEIEKKKNEHRRHAISHDLGRKMLHSKSVSAFEFAPDECPHLFIPETPHRKARANTKPPNEIVPSLVVSKLYVFKQRVKEHAAERRPGNNHDHPHSGWFALRV